MPSSKSKSKKRKVKIAGEIQKWNWLFLRLWEFCGPVNPACILNIPDTVLFKGAEPNMWLWTNPQGKIERKEFEFKIKAGETRSAADEKLRLVTERFLQLRPESAGGQFCVAWYRDGTSEHVDYSAFTRLAKHRQWRASLFGLQSYVAPKVSSMGLYSVHSDDQDDNLSVKGGPPARRNAALDMLCKKLALHLEAACKSFPLRKLIRVYRLVGSFIISEGDEKLYFLHSPELRAQPLEETFATQAEVEDAVYKITVAINNIVTVAQKRGMKMQQVFRYFDNKAEGQVSRDQFIANLVPLGIEVDSVHQLSLLRKIGLNNDGFIGFKEFKKFIKSTRKNIIAHEAKMAKLRGEGGTGSLSAKFLSNTESSPATPSPQTEDATRSSTREMHRGSSLAEIRSQARLESADGNKPTSKQRRAGLRGLDTGGIGSMDNNDLQQTKLMEEKLAPWARLTTHETLAEMERKAIRKADDDADAAHQRELADAAAADKKSQPVLHASELETLTFEVEQGVTMGYHVVPVSTTDDVKVDDQNSKNLMDAHHQALQKSAEIRGLRRRSDIVFRMVVLGDFFQSLESLSSLVAPLANQCTASSIVVANFPGQLGTVCRPSHKRVLLDNKYLAKCTAMLMRHLTESGGNKVWSAPNLDEAPIFVLGFGNGASVASYLLANMSEFVDTATPKTSPRLRPPQLLSTQLQYSLEGTILVNPFVHVGKQQRQMLQRLLKMPTVASRQERVQHLCSLLFSQAHLDSKGKSSALSSFFKSLGGVTDDAELDEGVELLVRGAMRNHDIRRSYNVDDLPKLKHLIVTSTEDSFIPATQTNDLIEALGGTRVFDATVEDCCGRKGEFGAHVAWLKAGHSVAQERPSFFLQLLQQFLSSAVLNRKPSMHKDKPPPGLLDGFVDDGTPGAKARFLRAKRQAMLAAATASATAIAPAATLSPQYANQSDVVSQTDPTIRATESGFSETLLEMQLQQAAYIERDLEREEGLMMAVEDELSRAVRNKEKAEAKWAEEAEATRQEVEKLKKMKEETEKRKEMERLQLEAAEKREAARLRKEKRKREMKVKSFALHDIDLEGQELGYGLESDDPFETVEGGKRLRHDMALVRKRKARALRKQIPIVEQQARMRETERSLEKMLEDVTRARVLAVKDKKSGRLHGERLKAVDVELSYLKVKEVELNPKLAKIQAHLRQVSEEADYLTSVVQQVIIVQRNLFGVMEQLLQKLQKDYDTLHRAKAQIIRDAEDSTERSFRLKKLLKQTRQRHLKLTEELERCAMWRKEWIDTVVYQDGVPQRIRKKQLVKFCKKEVVVVAQTIQKYERDLEECEEKRSSVDDRLTNFADNLVAFQDEAKKLKAAYEAAKAEQVKEQIAQQDASELAGRQGDAAAEMAKRHEALNVSLGLTNLAAQCRVKPADERSTEERKFVALDVLLHPELYLHVNEEDREVMDVDEAYHTTVTQAAVRRIATLPPELNLAAPHLYSADEVRAHVLIQKYEFGRGQEDLKKADCEVDLTRASRKVNRQFLAQSVRAKLPEERSDEEKEWISLDTLLRPQLYPYDEGEPCIVDPDLEREDIIQVVSKWRGALTTATEKKIWDLVYKYSEIGDVEGEEPLPPFPTQIVTRLSQVEDVVKVGPVLMHTGTKDTLLQSSENELMMRERHVHEFEIPTSEQKLPFNVRVNIIFKGVFDVRGYTLGRITAALFYKPESGGAIPCGHCPVDLLSLCTPTQFGRICIIHQPQVAPVAFGTYELVIVGCSRTVYSVNVDYEILQPVKDAIETVVRSSDHALRIKKVKSQIKEVKMTIRIGQRKLKLASALLRQAEAKYDKLNKHRVKFNAQLTHPEAQYLMNNAERRKLEATIAALDRELGITSDVVKLRLQEVESIRTPLAELLGTQRRFEADLLRLERELLAIRKSIPPVTASICGIALPTLVGEARDYRTINRINAPEWAKSALLSTMPYLKTPAHVTREKAQEQWTATEREWRKLDYILRPEKNQDLDASSMLGLANLPPYSQQDLEMLLERPERDLSDQELYDKNLLLEFHDRLPATKMQSKVLGARKFGLLWKKKAAERKEQRNRQRTDGRFSVGVVAWSN